MRLHVAGIKVYVSRINFPLKNRKTKASILKITSNALMLPVFETPMKAGIIKITYESRATFTEQRVHINPRNRSPREGGVRAQ